MLMHEWLKYRDKQIKQAGVEAEVDDEEKLVEAGEEALAHTERRRSFTEVREIAAALEQGGPESARQRLQALVGRQQRLPMEVEEAAGRRGGRGPRLTETRGELIERPLDPTLTLQEVAMLLGVCPTTVRRYTNRGVLRCFRTPGNQRRFRLSDVLDFMEQRQAAEI